MKKMLKEILEKIGNLDEKVDNLDEKVSNLDNKVNYLDITINGIKNEHSQMLRAIIESKEVQRGEIDILTHRTSKIEGTIKGTARQILNDLKDVSNK